MFLANYNSWRRDGETKDMPSPTEIGAAIDDAVNLLRKYDELERENAALREELKSSRKLVDALIIKADAFDYLAWLEKKRGEEEGLQGADFLCLASDGTTCWGKTYLEAVRIAEQQDRIAFDSAAIDAARKEKP